mmetsp:Transcript_21802/g.69019  ORF Transcript_21802/g.69019 Transcript_21802/m.69019 type:complete len:220 (+) Transcript_21802:33-692(+)
MYSTSEEREHAPGRQQGPRGQGLPVTLLHALLQNSLGWPFHVSFPQPGRMQWGLCGGRLAAPPAPRAGRKCEQPLLQNSPGLPLNVGLPQPGRLHTGPRVVAEAAGAAGERTGAGGGAGVETGSTAGPRDAMRSETALAAAFTVACHVSLPLELPCFPVVGSSWHAPWKKDFHRGLRPKPSSSSSRRIMSCRPSQLLPSPSWLSDQRLSRPATAEWSRR